MLTAAEKLVVYTIPEPNTGCLLWLRKGNRGYGQITVNYKQQSAARVAWEVVNGPIPPGLSVCHKCHTPCCVNVQHLFIGTHAENMHDMYDKGRARRRPLPGESNPNAVLTEAIVLEIRARRAAGQSPAEISRSMGLARANVMSIARGKSWRHAGGPIAPKSPAPSRLTPDNVRAIRAASTAGERRRLIADRFGITTHAVDAILSRRNWGWLD